MGKPSGVIGTAVDQQHLRSVLSIVNSLVLAQPDAYIQVTDGIITTDVEVREESTRDFRSQRLESFEGFIGKVAGATRPTA